MTNLSITSLKERLEQAVRPHFEANFAERGELGASVAVFAKGECVLSLAQGFCDREQSRVWDENTLVPVWSATKGPAAVACLIAMDEAGIELEDLVSRVWTEFGQAGKHEMTFAQMLSHRGGLSSLDEAVPMQDFDAVIAALEKQTPIFPIGTRQGYHARTFGFLLDKIVRLLTGAASLGEYFRAKIGGPMGLDFWIGLPESEMPRVATLYPGKMKAGAPVTNFTKAFMTKGSVTQRTFASPIGLNAVQEFNKPETLAMGFASFGGVGSALGLAKFYGILANGGKCQDEQLVSDKVLQWLDQTLSQDEDAVLCTPIAFGPGVMRDPVDPNGRKTLGKMLYGDGVRAFGHPGAGGSLAFGDPEAGYSFAYVMNQMELGALPTEKALSMARAVSRIMYE